MASYSASVRTPASRRLAICARTAGQVRDRRTNGGRHGSRGATPPGNRRLLAEIRPLIPPKERAWILVAELEVKALLSAEYLRAATHQLQAMQQAEARAAADPANTQWQRDLSVTRQSVDDLA